MTSLSKWEALAIKDINSSAEFVAKDIDNIRWLNGTTPISKSDIQTKANELETALAYKDRRSHEYPNLKDCLHALLDGGDTLTDLQAQRIVTKNKYPKPD